MYFFQFNQNSTIVTDLNVIRHQRSQNQPFGSRLLAEDPGPSIPNVVAILPDFDGFLLILSKLNYLYRFSRHPTAAMPKLTRCLPPAHWGPREADSQCIGNIAIFRCISSNFIKLDYLYRYSSNPTHPIPKLTLFSHLLAEDPGPPILSAVAILPDLDGFLQISSKLYYLYRFSRNPTLTMSISTLCLLPARWGPRALDSQYSGNIARLWWISSNFVRTRLSIQM